MASSSPKLAARKDRKAGAAHLARDSCQRSAAAAMDAVGVEDVGADDEVVRIGFAPCGPIGGSLLEHDAVALRVPATDDERPAFRSVCSTCAPSAAPRCRANRCPHRARAPAYHAARRAAISCVSAMAAGHSTIPYGSAAGLRTEALLVFMTENGAVCRSSTSVVRAKAVLIERQITRGGGEQLWLLRGHGKPVLRSTHLLRRAWHCNPAGSASTDPLCDSRTCEITLGRADF
jgi:hypothetical protein